MILQIFSIVVLGLLCGSELNVAAFAHPTISPQPMETRIPVRSSLAALPGNVMPFWMAGSALLNLFLVLPFERLQAPAWSLAAVALCIQIIAVLFSLIGPVPINNRIRKWTVQSHPNDWRAEERRWDLYHWLRTSGLVAAFTILVFSLGIR